MSVEDLLLALQPILDTARGLELVDPSYAQRALASRFPREHQSVLHVQSLVRDGVKRGWLADRRAGDVRYSRVAKDVGGVSIDVVHMSGPGAGHKHPMGEIDLCFPVDGDPTFDGRTDPWIVYAPGTWHVPTVSGGSMDILYFLPGGAIEFDAKRSA